ncbi:MAG: M14 family zinc carboxypeptidase [Phycisphaerae bacterium]
MHARLSVCIVLGALVSAYCGVVLAQPVAVAVPPTPTTLPGLTYDVPFFPGANYDANVPTPDSVLGFPVGSRPARHREIEAVIKAIAAKSARTRLFEYAKTHEGRTLYYLAVSSEQNIQRLDQIKADAAKLADPRVGAAADADKLIDTLPAIAWMAYCIHGDEMSGSDASLALAYHLAACADEPVRKMLEQLVVLIDPLMNPDGRDRRITTIAEARTSQPNVDDQSLLHSGIWPSGRMNHYLFDMNRDWIFGTQPESRGRIAAAGAWNPHYFLESHEMGSQDTFLFQPPREPLNPNTPANVKKWTALFAKDQAAAFDRRGWRYYTGEWNEEWYPGYSGAWGAMRNAVENLYEQANIQSDAVRRQEGTLETYRESVHHQLESSWVNLSTLAANRKTILADYVSERRRNVSANSPWANRYFAIVSNANAGRMQEFVELMLLQGFEVFSAAGEFTADGRDRLGRALKDRKFPAGTLLIPNRQPLAPLIAAMLEFDPHLTPAFLQEERRELLRFGRSRLYDVTAWNITMLFDVDGYELRGAPPAGATRIDRPPTLTGAVTQPDSKVAFVLDGADDRSVIAAGRLMERGVHVRVAEKPFEFDGKTFARGSVLVVMKDNLLVAGVSEALQSVATELKVTFTGIRSGWGEGDLPDLGGGYFQLLETPRIAVIGREPFDPYSYGETWHLIDDVLGLRASYLDAQQLDGMDLRRYNVLILPDGGGDAVKAKAAALKSWVEAGGTLIAVGGSAAALSVEKDGIGAARSIGDALGKLDEHRLAIVREWEGRNGVVEPEAVWSMTPPTTMPYPWAIAEGDSPSDDERKRRDAWREIFMPQGALLAARVDDRSWLTAGCGEFLPVLYGGGTTLLAWGEVEAPLRLGHYLPAAHAVSKPTSAPATQSGTANDGDDGKEKSEKPGWVLAPPGYELRLRISGLLWPEAADRLAHAAYVTRERVGSGQLIQFASNPTFRAAARGTTRVMANAIVYGPGIGARTPIRP